MEELLVFALLLGEELATKDAYRKILDKRFLEHPEDTSSTVIEIESGDVVAESTSSSSAEVSSDPQVEEFADFIVGDRETTVTFVNQRITGDIEVIKKDANTGSPSPAPPSIRRAAGARWRTIYPPGPLHTLDCSREALKLKTGEYVTEFRFQFGEVQEGFHQEDAPYILCSVNGDLPNEYRFSNRTDVDGQREKEWVTAKDAWVTVIYAKLRGKLPQTGW